MADLNQAALIAATSCPKGDFLTISHTTATTAHVFVQDKNKWDVVTVVVCSSAADDCVVTLDGKAITVACAAKTWTVVLDRKRGQGGMLLTLQMVGGADQVGYVEVDRYPAGTG